MTKALLALVALAQATSAFSAYTGECRTPEAVAALPAGHWCTVPNSHARAAEKKAREWDDWNGGTSAKYQSYQLNAGFSAIMSKWSGAAFDSKRDRLIVAGGGHNGYAGNELIAFNLATLSWSRLTDPTPFPVSNCDYVDPKNPGLGRHYKNPGTPETPISRHTYGGIEYLAASDQLFLFGGSGATCGYAINGLWTFNLAAAGRDPAANSRFWREIKTANEPPVGFEDISLYDAASDRVFYLKMGSPTLLASYHVSTHTWTLHNTSVNGSAGQFAVIDPKRRQLFQFNGSVPLRRFGLPRDPLGTLNFSTLTPTGDAAINTADSPGIAYDDAADKIVAYNGGTDVYAFNPDTNVWTRIPAAGDNRANPGKPTGEGGIFGRFRYSARYNVYVYVDSVDSDVYLYRFTAAKSAQP